MSTHWWYVSVAWGLGLVLFGGLLADTLRRQSAARRRLAALETRRPGMRTSP
jgi:heme exporter protein CcmD